MQCCRNARVAGKADLNELRTRKCSEWVKWTNGLADGACLAKEQARKGTLSEMQDVLSHQQGKVILWSGKAVIVWQDLAWSWIPALLAGGTSENMSGPASGTKSQGIALDVHLDAGRSC